MERENKGFFVYNDYIKSAYKALSEEQFKDFATAMVLYGTVGSYPPINPIAEVFLIQVMPFIDKYYRKYTKAKKGGANGGRPPKVTKNEIKKKKTGTHLSLKPCSEIKYLMPYYVFVV